ncbi:MAG TPA: hypothetical protein VGS06_42210 [Streptosporangiaceae bacterium]|nr:hypothetical protein [Streptosporangiaceae bacterium]
MSRRAAVPAAFTSQIAAGCWLAGGGLLTCTASQRPSADQAGAYGSPGSVTRRGAPAGPPRRYSFPYAM